MIFLSFGSALAGRLELEYERALHPRVFLLGGAPEGIWFAWSIGGFQRQSRPKLEGVDVNLAGMQTGGMFGYPGVWGRFAFTLGGGATYSYGRLEVLGQSVKDGEWDPWFKIGLGVAFWLRPARQWRALLGRLLSTKLDVLLGVSRWSTKSSRGVCSLGIPSGIDSVPVFIQRSARAS